MAKNSIQQFSTTASSNTDIAGINVNTGWLPGNVGSAERALMAMLAAFAIPQIVALGSTSVTLTAAQASALFLAFSGTPGGTCTVTLPNQAMQGWVANTSNQSVILTTGAGTTVTIASSATNWTMYAVDGSGNVTTPTPNFNSGISVTGGATIDTATVSGTGAIATVTSSGSVVVRGSAYGAGSAPLVAETTNTGNAGAGVFRTNAAVAGASCVVVRNDRTDGISIQFLFGSSGVGSITQNGSSTSYNTSSDQRLKVHVGEISFTESGQIIDKIVARWFQWKEFMDRDPEPGFFAQQVYRVYPWAVVKGRGKPGNKHFRPWQIDQARLMPIVIAELQSLRARVKALEKG